VTLGTIKYISVVPKQYGEILIDNVKFQISEQEEMRICTSSLGEVLYIIIERNFKLTMLIQTQQYKNRQALF
jgi:hypothetical protein